MQVVMCSVIILYRPGHDWPLIIGSNRDEMTDRTWQPPARHWEDHPQVVAGLDELAGGTWLGLNDDTVVSLLLNKINTLGPKEGFRSRGELPLEALDHADAESAVEAFLHLEINSYRSFNMVIADPNKAFWLCLVPKNIKVHAIEPGISMITALELNDPKSPRIQTYLPQFCAAEVPNPETDNWAEWQSLLASKVYDPEHGPSGAMNIDHGNGFGTVSSSLIALPAPAKFETQPKWLTTNGRPGDMPYQPVDLGS
jgi:uncharacterized protein with NRDE domain